MLPAHRHDTKSRQTRRGLLEGVAVGAVYGVLLRGYVVLQNLLSHRLDQYRSSFQVEAMNRKNLSLHNLAISGEVMTVAFLVLGSAVIGYLTVRRMSATCPPPLLSSIAAPWLAIVCMMLVVALFAWEGAICVVMALPLAMLFSSIGGVLAGLLSAKHSRLSTGSTACLALLPFVLAPAETLLPSPTQTRTVHNQILIHASPDIVWHNIERVPAITHSELKSNWTHRIGFPRPVEATLSYEGVGGVRHASFERGLLFIETVDAWEPDQRLGFSIHADSAQIPPTTLDEHVTLGGRYFDVLHGEYRLEPLTSGDTLLHLSSQQRLSTNFNGYAGLWTDAVMSSLQGSILQVIQHRCEHQTTATLNSH